DFCDAISEFFSSGKLLGEVNATLIRLVPRNKVALSQIVDENQSAFVPGRAINDNILLARELLKRKKSLWVKWVNVVKLKNKSVRDISADNKDSWGWKCLLDLRGWIGNHMRYKIGDGIDKISNVFGEHGWKLLGQWVIKHPWIANIQVPILSNQHDRAIWVDNKGSEKRFSTNTVWKDVRGSSSNVSVGTL
nr:hypothetical protein [Tanacetum cinerariifolium]